MNNTGYNPNFITNDPADPSHNFRHPNMVQQSQREASYQGKKMESLPKTWTSVYLSYAGLFYLDEGKASSIKDRAITLFCPYKSCEVLDSSSSMSPSAPDPFLQHMHKNGRFNSAYKCLIATSLITAQENGLKVKSPQELAKMFTTVINEGNDTPIDVLETLNLYRDMTINADLLQRLIGERKSKSNESDQHQPLNMDEVIRKQSRLIYLLLFDGYSLSDVTKAMCHHKNNLPNAMDLREYIHFENTLKPKEATQQPSTSHPDEQSLESLICNEAKIISGKPEPDDIQSTDKPCSPETNLSEISQTTQFNRDSILANLLSDGFEFYDIEQAFLRLNGRPETVHNMKELILNSVIEKDSNSGSSEPRQLTSTSSYCPTSSLSANQKPLAQNTAHQQQLLSQNTAHQQQLLAQNTVYQQQFEELKRENKQLERKLDERKCFFCLDKIPNRVFNPCGHTICEDCNESSLQELKKRKVALAERKCLTCSKVIKKVNLLFNS